MGIRREGGAGGEAGAVAEKDDAEGHENYHPVLTVDEEVSNEVVGGVVFVGGCEELRAKVSERIPYYSSTLGDLQ